MIISNAAAVTFSENTILNLPKVGTLGMGHALQTWTVGAAWSLTGTKNKINNCAGAILIATKYHG